MDVSAWPEESCEHGRELGRLSINKKLRNLTDKIGSKGRGLLVQSSICALCAGQPKGQDCAEREAGGKEVTT